MMLQTWVMVRRLFLAPYLLSDFEGSGAMRWRGTVTSLCNLQNRFYADMSQLLRMKFWLP